MATGRATVVRPKVGGLARPKAKVSGGSPPKLSGGPAAKASGARPATPSATAGKDAPRGRPRSSEAASIDALTKQLHEVLAALNDADAASRVQVGDVLAQAKAKLAHGAWLGWVKAHVGREIRWVQESMKLAAWSRANPAMFGRVRRLGSDKVMELKRLRLDQLDALLLRREHVVPSTGERVSMEAITVLQLREVVKALLGRRPTKDEGGIDALISAARGSANKTIESIKWMIANKKAVSPKFAEDLHDDLAQWLEALEDAFGLDQGE